MDNYDIINYPLSTEKAVRLMNDQNKLLFVVNPRASKQDIKQAVEQMFKAKVVGVKTLIVNGKKRAYVKFSSETPAIDISTQLGFM